MLSSYPKTVPLNDNLTYVVLESAEEEGGKAHKENSGKLSTTTKKES